MPFGVWHDDTNSTKGALMEIKNFIVVGGKRRYVLARTAERGESSAALLGKHNEPVRTSGGLLLVLGVAIGLMLGFL